MNGVELADGLATIDYLIVIMYMMGVLILGVFFARYIKTGGDFFIGGRALPFWAIGMSVVVSDIGAVDFIGVAGEAYNSGIGVANFDWIGSMPALVFAAFIFIPYYWRAGVYTIPEFLGKRYNSAIQIIMGLIWGMTLLVGLSVMLWVTAEQFLHGVLGWNIWFSVGLMAFIAGVYTFSGGLSAVVMTDVVQMIIMFIGGFALLFLALWEIGGVAALKEKVVASQPRIVLNFPGAPADVEEEQVLAALETAGFDINYVKKTAEIDILNPNQFIVRLNTAVPPDMLDRVQIDEDGFMVNQAAMLAEARDRAIAAVEPLGRAEVQFYQIFDRHFTILLPHDTPSGFPWTGVVFGLGIVMATAYMSGNQAVVQRALGARSEWDAKGGMLFAGFLKSFIPLLVAVPGLAAVVLLPDLPKGDSAVPGMIKMLLPPGLRGLMFAALFAALMSSVDSTLNSASTIWTTDLYGRFVRFAQRRSLNEREALFVGRSFTVVFIILAAFLSKTFGDNRGIYNFLQTVLSLFQGPVFAILLLGIMWRRTTQWGALAGLLIGVLFTNVLTYTPGLFYSDDTAYLFVSWWSFVLTLVVTTVVSLVTPKDPDEKVRGLIFGQVMHDGEVQRVLQERVSD
jgi:Na+/proline symporter